MAPAWKFIDAATSARQVLIGLTLAAFVLCAPLMARATTLVGEVVAISDGDTLTLLDETKTQHKIRLAGIDAPEKKQAFGQRSKQNLATLVFRKQVVVEWTKVDRYGRIIGKVSYGGADICLTQVRDGLAWHYKAYQKEQPRADRETYAAAENEARRTRRGLWGDSEQTAPWDYRHAGRPRAEDSPE